MEMKLNFMMMFKFVCQCNFVYKKNGSAISFRALKLN